MNIEMKMIMELVEEEKVKVENLAYKKEDIEKKVGNMVCRRRHRGDNGTKEGGSQVCRVGQKEG